jgi:hypothetical protein
VQGGGAVKVEAPVARMTVPFDAARSSPYIASTLEGAIARHVPPELAAGYRSAEHTETGVRSGCRGIKRSVADAVCHDTTAAAADDGMNAPTPSPDTKSLH